MARAHDAYGADGRHPRPGWQLRASERSASYGRCAPVVDPIQSLAPAHSSRPRGRSELVQGTTQSGCVRARRAAKRSRVRSHSGGLAHELLAATRGSPIGARHRLRCSDSKHLSEFLTDGLIALHSGNSTPLVFSNLVNYGAFLASIWLTVTSVRGDVLLGAEIALPAPVSERGILRDPRASGRLFCRRKVRHDAAPGNWWSPWSRRSA